jgi:hypothetical protein
MQGEVVSGLIGGAVVLLGVILAEALIRSRDRRRRLEQAALALTLQLPIHLVYLTADSPEPEGMKVGSAGWSAEQRVLELLIQVQTLCGRWGRRQRRLRQAANDLAARHSAAVIRYYQGQTLERKDLFGMIKPDLMTLVFPGKTKPLDEQIEHYLSSG